MQARPQKRIAITTGEPAGIGPDITLMALCTNSHFPKNIYFDVLGDTQLLQDRAALLGLSAQWQQVLTQSDHVRIVHHPLRTECIAGQLNERNGAYVLALLDTAIAACLNNKYAAMVTAPLQKSVINQGAALEGRTANFTGHTEYLAEQTHTQQVVMLLAGRQQITGTLHNRMLRVALATTHLPLQEVAATLRDQIGQAGLVDILKIIDHDLRTKFSIAEPKILVTGLNPHAGESGYLGREEIDVIAPAIALAKQAGINATGPYPADTVFQPRYLQEADCVLAMYHDQGLAPLKYGTFGQGINVTLGLPIIRTSVDHGTALDLAGTGHASPESMRAAIDAAIEMVH